MRNSFLCWQKCSIKYVASVCAGKTAGFTGWMEQLKRRSAVDGEVIYRFVDCWLTSDVWSLREHGEDGFCVRNCKGFSLERI